MKQELTNNILRKAHNRLFEALGGTEPASEELTSVILWLINYSEHVDNQYRSIVSVYNDLNRLGIYDTAETLHPIMEAYTSALVQVDNLIESAKTWAEDFHMTDAEYLDA